MNLFVPGAFKINTVAKIVEFYFTSFCFKLLPSNETENRDCVWHMLDSPPFGSIVCTSFEPYIPLRNDERKNSPKQMGFFHDRQINGSLFLMTGWIAGKVACHNMLQQSGFLVCLVFFLRFVPLLVLVPLETCWSGNTTLLSTLLQIRLFTLSVGSFVRPSEVGDCRAPSIHSSTTNQPLQTFWPNKRKEEMKVTKMLTLS